jgi:hypothetical protein
VEKRRIWPALLLLSGFAEYGNPAQVGWVSYPTMKNSDYTGFQFSLDPEAFRLTVAVLDV